MSETPCDTCAFRKSVVRGRDCIDVCDNTFALSYGEEIPEDGCDEHEEETE